MFSAGREQEGLYVIIESLFQFIQSLVCFIPKPEHKISKIGHKNI